jgi:hypothetical protein
MKINKTALILKPRLDIPFKDNGAPVPEVVGPPNHPVRLYWMEFTNKLTVKLKEIGYEVVDIEMPLWQMNFNLLEELRNRFNFQADVLFVPHRDPYSFANGNEYKNVYYYMQTVFPHLFSINNCGWGGDIEECSHFSFPKAFTQTVPYVFDEYRLAIDRNESKFPQPNNNNPLPFDKYVLFTCQIPHDETIKLHSNVEVIDGLKSVLEFTKRWGLNLIVKGHPINSGSMVDLKALTGEYPHARWVLEEHSIHKLLANCEALFTVNSGTGMEGILHKKPVYIFGRSDYSTAVSTVKPNYDSIRENWKIAEQNIPKYEQFFNRYVHSHFNVRE